MIDPQYKYALCEIRTMSNDLIAKGKMTLVGSDFLEISHDVGSISLLRYEQKIKVMINHQSLPSKEVEGILYIPTLDFFRVVDVKPVMEKEQRNFFRVNVLLEAAAGVDIKEKSISDLSSITIIDLSLNGALVKTQTIWDIETKISLFLEVSGRNITLDGIISRIKNNDDGSFAYGIRFQPMDDSTANAVCQFLFSKQKEALKFNKT